MARYIEKETNVEVDVTCVMAFRGGTPDARAAALACPVVAIVTMPDGYRYGMLQDQIDTFFDIVTPQNIVVEAIACHGPYDRT
jgi:hypothetical protein